jgi:hypothetical protein
LYAGRKANTMKQIIQGFITVLIIGLPALAAYGWAVAAI